METFRLKMQKIFSFFYLKISPENILKNNSDAYGNWKYVK